MHTSQCTIAIKIIELFLLVFLLKREKKNSLRARDAFIYLISLSLPLSLFVYLFFQCISFLLSKHFWNSTVLVGLRSGGLPLSLSLPRKVYPFAIHLYGMNVPESYESDSVVIVVVIVRFVFCFLFISLSLSPVRLSLAL